MMDSILQQIADSQPSKPPRSKLEFHREFIRKMRRKGLTYRELARVLRDQLGVPVAPSTIHSFIKVRAKHRKLTQFELPSPESEETAKAASDSISGRIAALKCKPVATATPKRRFSFQESEPLKLASGGEW
jgi:hypothetical protein